MATQANRNISAASAGTHTKKSAFPSGILRTALAVLLIGFVARAYQAIRPPPPKIVGSPGGPPVTAPRIKLRDGRHIAYREYCVPKERAKYKVISIPCFDAIRHDEVVANYISPDVIEELGINIISFDRPGYGESDPNPNQTIKSLALDIEELADQLGLGSKFYVIGYSMGGQLTWGCLKYIPHRLAGAALIVPAVNYWWSGFPEKLAKEAFSREKTHDQWAYRVAHYTPWLTYWLNTQQWFPSPSIMVKSFELFSPPDLELIGKVLSDREKYEAQIRQQGEYETVHSDLNLIFHNWEFSPMDLENPFPNNEGSVHIWQGADDWFVSPKLNSYIGKKLPWIHYHEIANAGHMLPFAEGMSDNIMKSMLQGK